MTRTCYSRRDFFHLASASALATLGWPRAASWAAGEGPSESLRIVYYTDIHARVEWDTPEAMSIASRRINEQAADLVLCGGDMITDGFQSSAGTVAPRWDAYMDMMHNAIRPPVHSMIGNHDLVGAMPADGTPPSQDPRAEFKKRMGVERTYRSFEAAGCRIFILDCIEVTGDDLQFRGFVPQEQLQWISAELQGVDQDTPLILMTHMPLLTSFYQATAGSESPAPRNRVVVNNREVLAAFANHNLVIVLQGHLHVNEMLRWQNTTFITGGAVCGKWWRGAWYGTEEGFGILTLKGRNIVWDYLDLGWNARRPPGA